MRKLPLLILLFPGLLSAVAPVSMRLGNVAVSIEDGSIEKTALEAVKGEYTEEWLMAYTSRAMIFAEAYSPLLSSVLPMSNVLVGEERNGTVPVLDQDTGVLLSLSFRDGKIAALTPLSLPDTPCVEENSQEESLPGEDEEALDEVVAEDIPEEGPVDAGGDPGIPYLYEIRFPGAT